MMLAPVIPTDEDSGPRREIRLFDDAPIQGGAELFALRLALFAAQRGAPMRIGLPEGTEPRRPRPAPAPSTSRRDSRR